MHGYFDCKYLSNDVLASNPSLRRCTFISPDFITLPTGVAVYGLSAGSNGDVFVTDAGNFNSAGKVYIYNSAGVKQSEFAAGIAPNAVIVNE